MTNTEPSPELIARCLLEGRFRFQHMCEAQAIANFISNACPNPRLAVVGITELFINGIEHGNLGISYEEKTILQKENKWIEEIERRLALPENKNKFVVATLSRTNTEILIHVKDQGPGFDWKKFETPNNNEKTKTHGRGISIAKNIVFSRLEFVGNGNEVTGVIPLEA